MLKYVSSIINSILTTKRHNYLYEGNFSIPLIYSTYSYKIKIELFINGSRPSENVSADKYTNLVSCQ